MSGLLSDHEKEYVFVNTTGGKTLDVGGRQRTVVIQDVTDKKHIEIHVNSVDINTDRYIHKNVECIFPPVIDFQHTKDVGISVYWLT